jgi:hypothetical protein
VPFCRAALSTLARTGAFQDLLCGMKLNFEVFGSYAQRVRRSSREILIAAVLTVAAFAFLLAAVWSGTVSGKSKLGNIAAEDQSIK